MERRSIIQWLTALLLLHESQAQLFNFRENIKSSLQECTNEEFIQGTAECFVEKFEDLPIPYSSSYSYSADTFNTGRRPLGLFKTELKDSAIRQNYVVPQISKHLSATHKKLLNAVWTAGRAAVEKEHQYMAYEKLRHTNLKEMIHKYIVDLMHHNVLPYVQKLKLHQFEFNTENEFGESYSNTLNCEDLAICVGLGPSPACAACRFFDAFLESNPNLVETVNNTVSCLSEFSDTDFEDGVRWLKCFYNCEDLPPISSCLKAHFSQCGDWSVVGDVIMKGFVEFTQLDTCMLKVVSARNMTVVEGGESAEVQFYNYLPPAVHCLDFQSLSEPLGMIRALGSMIGILLGDSPQCTVEVQMSLQNYWHDLLPHNLLPGDLVNTGRPKCHDGTALRQAVVGFHDYNNDTIETCIVQITDDNWNETFTVPIWASVDLKNDGNVTTDFTLKLVSNGNTVYNDKLSVEIVDADVENSTLCQSSGDPHITTFDGHYYNNLYEGYFYMYRNMFLPYEVQVIYQRCTPEADASCTCAVAVKSGDDVFVVDRCRRTGMTDSSQTIMRTVMFVNDDLTPGTRVFSKHQGAEMQVILPTGFTVTIVTSNDALSVFLNPSNYEFTQSEGLCGFFDGDASNDLMMVNGTTYDGDGSEERGQPQPFSEDWRVPEEDRIFEGALSEEEPEDIGRYCKCNHVVFQGVQCTCGPGELVETCDMDLSGEITDVVSALFKNSRKSHDLDSNIGMSDIDVDEGYEPPEIGWGSVWNSSAADTLCRELLGGSSPNALIQECHTKQGDPFMEEAYWHCIEDIQITDSDKWRYAAMESGKRKCTTYYTRGVDLGYTYMQYASDACLNDCSGQGVCENGTCACSDGWMGGDCSIQADTPVVVMDDSAMCDTRVENCSYATIYGRYFRPDGSLSCHLRHAERQSDGSYELTDKTDETKDILFISTYQVACELPDVESYEITLEHDGQPLAVYKSGVPDTYAESFIFMVYDSACYECSLVDEKCTERPAVGGVNQYCLIDSGCYAPGQQKADDSCRYCNNTEDDDSWTWYTDETCALEQDEYLEEQDRAHREKVIRISLASILSALIIVLTIVLYVMKSRQKEMELGEDVKPVDGDVNYYKASSHEYTNEAIQLNEVSSHKVMPSRQVQKVKDYETGHGSRLNSVSSIGSTSDLETARKMAAKERRKRQSRADSTCSERSVRSIGLGASGPVQYSQYNKVVDDGQDHLIGMGGHASPSLPTKNSTHSDIHVNAAF